jgi:hypothetical protein
MAELKIKGTVKLLMDVQTFDSGFTKREFVITTQEQYPQDVKLEVTQQRVELLDSVKVGQTVDVSFNIRGNEYNGRYFVNLQAWKIESVAVAQAPVTPASTVVEDSDDDGDLPF